MMKKRIVCSNSLFFIDQVNYFFVSFFFFKSQSHKLDTFKMQEYIYLVASFSISLYLFRHIIISIKKQLKVVFYDSDQIMKFHFLIKAVIIFYILVERCT